MTILTDNGYMEGDEYYFYIKDYQGNNRVVFDQSGAVEQVDHYYPYGGIFGEGLNSASNGQPYKYGGKEFDRINGLDMYDFGARHLDSATAGWSTIDPLAEKYYGISPYAYCAGNPILYTDPNGKEIWIGSTRYTAGMQYKGKDQFTRSMISALNLIYKSGGDKAIGDLVKSKAKYNYKENNSEAGHTVQNKDGSVDININTGGGRNQFISATAHETMHGVQYENGQGGASIFNEVEAYAFEMNISFNSLNDLSTGFQAGAMIYNENNPISNKYNQALNKLSYDGYSAFDMNTAIKTFKKGSGSNNTGVYNGYPLRIGKEKKSMLQKYMKAVK